MTYQVRMWDKESRGSIGWHRVPIFPFCIIQDDAIRYGFRIGWHRNGIESGVSIHNIFQARQRKPNQRSKINRFRRFSRSGNDLDRKSEFGFSWLIMIEKCDNWKIALIKKLVIHFLKDFYSGWKPCEFWTENPTGERALPRHRSYKLSALKLSFYPPPPYLDYNFRFRTDTFRIQRLNNRIFDRILYSFVRLPNDLAGHLLVSELPQIQYTDLTLILFTLSVWFFCFILSSIVFPFGYQRGVLHFNEVVRFAELSGWYSLQVAAVTGSS